MPFDKETRRFYAENAATYAGREREGPEEALKAFTALLPPGGRVLELGCGGGQDSFSLIEAGFDVTPTDGSPELAAEAERRLGRKVKVMLFEDLADADAYDGIWACASLLHVPLTDLAGILAKIHTALRPGGWLFASFKAGNGEGRDSFQRFYSYPTIASLKAEFERAAHWAVLETRSERGPGYDQAETDWIWVTARK